MSTPSDPVVIVGAARTPMGSFQSDFASQSAHDLGGVAIKAAVQRSGVNPELVDEVLFGNCLMAGQGQAPARQAALKGGLPMSAGAVTLSKMCGSGMKATMLAHDMLLAGSATVMVSGGMESMTNAPYLMLKGRGGYRMGHDRIYDHMMLDGLEDAYEPGRSMGTFGEDCAAKYSFTREQQDAFAIASVTRAKAATESGAFATEIAPVTVKDRSGERVVSIDEGPGKVKLDKVTSLKPAFKKDGTITAASSSSINDGEGPGPETAGPHRGPRDPRAGTQLVCHRARGRHEKAVGQNGLGRGRCGLLGNQRSVCRGTDGAHDRAVHPARESERERWRLRLGSPHRRQRRAHPGHAAARNAGTRRQKGRGHAVHRRWRSHGHGHRTAVTKA
jgi:hypothetical protein